MAEERLGSDRDIVQRTAEGAPVLQDYQREDTRWERATSVRDWIILLVLIVLHTSWMLVVFFLEPGIR
jgi:hypothetical protein